MAAEVAEATAAAGRPAPPGTREPGPVHFGGGPRATVARGGKAKRLRGELAERVGAKLVPARRDAGAGKREARDQARARSRRADCARAELPPLEDASARATGPRPALVSAAIGAWRRLEMGGGAWRDVGAAAPARPGQGSRLRCADCARAEMAPFEARGLAAEAARIFSARLPAALRARTWRMHPLAPLARGRHWPALRRPGRHTALPCNQLGQGRPEYRLDGYGRRAAPGPGSAAVDSD